MILKGIKTSALLLVGGLVVFLGLQAWQWYHPSKRLTAWRIQPTPYRAVDASLVRDIPEGLIPLPPGGIVGLKPSKREVQKLEKKLGGEIPKAGPILAVVEVEKLPDGGRAVVTLEPVPEAPDTSRAVVTIFPRKKKFFELEIERSVGGYYGQGLGRLDGRFFALDFEQSVLRTGPVVWGFKAGTFLLPEGTFSYVMVGGRVRF